MRSYASIAVLWALAWTPLAYAQPEAGAPDAGTPEAGVDAGAPPEAGVEIDAGLPRGEHDDGEEESELPEEHRPEVEYRIEPADGIMTGDLVHAIIVVRLRAEDDDVTIGRQAALSGGGGDLELHDQRHTDRRIDGRREFTFELDFLALEPGEHTIAPIVLRVVTAAGVIGTVRTEARTVTVGALTANEPDAQPRPATPPVVVMEDDYTLAWVLGILGAMLLSALAGWLLARWWRARPKAAPPPPPPRPPGEVALEKLRALRKRTRRALDDGKQGEIVDGASDVLREYLGARYGFNGLESTTDEVIARLRNERLGAISLNEVIALLGDADLVKFAKAMPDEPQCDRMIEGAERIVLGTVPMSTAITPPAPRIDQTPVRPKKRTSKAPAETKGATKTEIAGGSDPAEGRAADGPATESQATATQATASPAAHVPPSEDAAEASPPSAVVVAAPADKTLEDVGPPPSPPSAPSTDPSSSPPSKLSSVEPALPSSRPPAPLDPSSATHIEDEVDHLGRRIPDTNPPPPPDPSKMATAPTAPEKPSERPRTLVGHGDPVEPTEPPAETRATDPSVGERKTPVGFRDPKDGGPT